MFSANRLRAAAGKGDLKTVKQYIRIGDNGTTEHFVGISELSYCHSVHFCMFFNTVWRHTSTQSSILWSKSCCRIVSQSWC